MCAFDVSDGRPKEGPFWDEQLRAKRERYDIQALHSKISDLEQQLRTYKKRAANRLEKEKLRTKALVTAANSASKHRQLYKSWRELIRKSHRDQCVRYERKLMTQFDKRQDAKGRVVTLQPLAFLGRQLIPLFGYARISGIYILCSDQAIPYRVGESCDVLCRTAQHNAPLVYYLRCRDSKRSRLYLEAVISAYLRQLGFDLSNPEGSGIKERITSGEIIDLVRHFSAFGNGFADDEL